ncbi:copper uptake system-associated protein [Reyranella sp.]|uniref:copper uptake system-associated protein n=1 Tax=Reyranella sp. TaxID=1929291 RepID=UPI003D12986F
MSVSVVSRRLVIAAMPVLGFALPAEAQTKPSEDTAIRQLLGHTFARPDAALTLDPIVVEGEAALVGWSQADMAGRALLRATDGQWAIVACGGDAIKSPATLQRLGVPASQAARLSAAMASAEAKLEPKRVARLDSFAGIMEMGGAAHPPAHRP